MFERNLKTIFLVNKTFTISYSSYELFSDHPQSINLSYVYMRVVMRACVYIRRG